MATSLSLVGWLERGTPRPGHVAVRWLLLAASALALLGVLKYSWGYRSAQGRYLYPALGPMVLLGCAGVARLAEAWLRPGIRRGTFFLLGAAAPLLALVYVHVVVRPELAFEAE